MLSRVPSSGVGQSIALFSIVFFVTGFLSPAQQGFLMRRRTVRSGDSNK